MESELKLIRLTALEENNGQIDGVPANPRLIEPEELEALKQSIQDNPEMLSLREIICVPVGEKFVVICGNMRLRALQELGYEEAICKVVENTTSKQLRAYVIKDNISFGKHDFLKLADWDEDELFEFGFDIKKDDIDIDNFLEDSPEREKDLKILIKLSREYSNTLDEIKEQLKEFLKKYNAEIR